MYCSFHETHNTGKKTRKTALLSLFAMQMLIAAQLKIILKHQSKTCTKGFAIDTKTLDDTFLTMMLTMFRRESSSGLYL